ncbi:E4 protein [Bos taurus papillomavirus 11]|uniref:E4 protein n=1 Tax=Bos taurus papillomavirus 11 TaxID=714200 RepID=E1CGC1_9PAPI|nr:E4 protein [Bos taurus papillomavirus 11]
MHHCILTQDNGKCILKTKFFLPLLPVRFLLGPPGDDGPKPGTTPNPEEGNLPNLPETPGDGRSRSRHRDLGPDRDRPRRNRTPEEERRGYRGNNRGDPLEEDEGSPQNNVSLEDRLRQLLDKWEDDIGRLRQNLRLALLAL